MGTAKVGNAKVGTAKVGTAKVGTAKVGTAKVRAIGFSGRTEGEVSAGMICVHPKPASSAGRALADGQSGAWDAGDGVLASGIVGLTVLEIVGSDFASGVSPIFPTTMRSLLRPTAPKTARGGHERTTWTKRNQVINGNDHH